MLDSNPTELSLQHVNVNDSGTYSCSFKSILGSEGSYSVEIAVRKGIQLFTFGQFIKFQILILF